LKSFFSVCSDCGPKIKVLTLFIQNIFYTILSEVIGVPLKKICIERENGLSM